MNDLISEQIRLNELKPVVKSKKRKGKMKDLQKEYDQLRDKYNADKVAWKKYKDDVEKWRDQVMKIFSRLKAENQRHAAPTDDILALKRQLMEKEEEVRVLKAQLTPPNQQASNL